MAEELVDQIDNSGIYAKRAECDEKGVNIDQYYAKKSEIPSVPVQDVEVNGSSVVDGNGVAKVAVPTKTSDLTNDSGFITMSDVPAQEQADWTESNSSDPAYIKNKPSVKTLAEGSHIHISETANGVEISADGLPASTSADEGKVLGVDSSGNPEWQAAPTFTQEQADWNQSNSSAVDYIKNKPDIRNVPAVGSGDDGKVLKATYSGGVGSYSWDVAPTGLPPSTAQDEGKILGVDSQGDPEWQAAPTFTQQQADWNQSDNTAVDYIKNKPQNLVQDPDYVHTDNNYTDTDEAKLAGIEAGAEVNVQADWNQSDSSADDYIKNKPSIPAAQVQSDWSQTDSNAVDYIKNKPTINNVPASTSADEGKVLTVDSSGNPEWEDPAEELYIFTNGTAATDATNIAAAITAGKKVVLRIQDGNYYYDLPLAFWRASETFRFAAWVDSQREFIKTLDYADDAWAWSATVKKTIIPDSSSIDAGRVLTVGSNGKPVWDTVPQADWNETNSSDPSYIKNKPSIPAAQVQSDWSQSDSSAVDYIKNKPSIPAAQVQSDWSQSDSSAVDYIKNKPNIPAAQVQADYAQSNSAATDYIKNKPNFVEGTHIRIEQVGNDITISDKLTAGNGIDIDANGVISVDGDDLEIDYWHGSNSSAIVSGTSLNTGLSSISYRGTNIYADSGIVMLKKGTYAIHAFVKINNSSVTKDSNLYKFTITGGITGGSPIKTVEFDNSFTHEDIYELSFLTFNTSSTDAALVLTIDALSQLSGVSVTLSYIQVYCLNGLVGTSGGGGSGTANISITSTDHSVTVVETTIGDTRSFDLSVTQEQSDWTEADTTDPAYIKNKPAGINLVAGQNVNITEDPTNNTLEIAFGGSGTLPASTSADEGKVLTVDSSGDPQWDDLPEGTPENVVLTYGTSTWADFTAALATNSAIFCDAGSGRYAVMAYKASTLVEFQYVRTVNDTQWPLASNGYNCEVYKFTLDSSSNWTTASYPVAFKPVTGNGIKLYSNANRELQFAVDIPVYTDGNNSILWLGANGSLSIASSLFASKSITKTYTSPKAGGPVFASQGSTSSNVLALGNRFNNDCDQTFDKETVNISFTGTPTAVSLDRRSLKRWNDGGTGQTVNGDLVVKYGLFHYDTLQTSTPFKMATDPKLIVDLENCGTLSSEDTSTSVTLSFTSGSFNNVIIPKGAKFFTAFYIVVDGVQYFFMNALNPYGSSSNLTITSTMTGSVATLISVPASTSADEGKVLTVDSSGNAVWDSLATTAQIEAIVT
jgi:hypothetical protein